MDAEIKAKIDQFFKQFKQQKFQQSQILVRADEDPTGIIYLTEGEVKQYAISQKGEELVVNIFKPGAFFPMSWAINKTPNTYYFEALTPVEVWRASEEEVILFVQKNPDVLFNLLKRLYSGTDGLLAKLVYLMSGEASNRLVTELLIMAKRFGKKTAENEITEISISEKELAAQTGMARETISRELKKLKEQGVLSLEKGSRILLNIEKLEQSLL